MATEGEEGLLEKAVLYLAEKKFNDGISNNRKRQIRAKAKKFVLKSDAFYYNPGNTKPVFMRMGLPKLLTSDQGGEFKSDLEKKITRFLQIKRHYITPCHPQANGLDKHWNQTLKAMTVKFTAGKKDQCDEYLPTCVFAYNTAKHESTLNTTFEVMFGRKANLAINLDFEDAEGEQFLHDTMSKLTATRKELLQTTRNNVAVAQERQKEQRKKRKGGAMRYKWLGPYHVINDVGKGFYSLKDVASNAVIKRIHGAHLKQFKTPPTSPATSQSLSEDSSYIHVSESSASKDFSHNESWITPSPLPPPIMHKSEPHSFTPLNSSKSSPSLSSLPPQSNYSIQSIPKSSPSNNTSTESLVQNQSQEHATNNETPDYEKDSVQPLSSVFPPEFVNVLGASATI
uniref:Integrase catalytic domain-containing protein n=1 Tax=Amphimedon queenslandica TaxID=400682 RepID=A0A1X7UVJ1_AMPQE